MKLVVWGNFLLRWVCGFGGFEFVFVFGCLVWLLLFWVFSGFGVLDYVFVV